VKIEIPDAVYRRAAEVGRGKEHGKGAAQMQVLDAYLRDKVGTEVIVGWERDEDGKLFAVTAAKPAPDPNIPAEHRKRFGRDPGVRRG
jgi:hypothetical protein